MRGHQANLVQDAMQVLASDDIEQSGKIVKQKVITTKTGSNNKRNRTGSM